MSKPFDCDHYCRYCLAGGCEERTDLPLQTVSISVPPRTATTFVSEDGNTISVAGADGSVRVTIKKGGRMKKQKEKRYRLTMTEKQLHYMMAAVEDWHRSLCGQCELSNATAYADECHDAREALQKHVRPYIVPELPDPRSSYGWSGGGCPNKYQREAIAVTYMLYREPMHYLTVHNGKDTSWNVYNSDTLTCPEQGPLITIEEVEE